MFTTVAMGVVIAHFESGGMMDKERGFGSLISDGREVLRCNRLRDTSM